MRRVTLAFALLAAGCTERVTASPDAGEADVRIPPDLPAPTDLPAVRDVRDVAAAETFDTPAVTDVADVVVPVDAPAAPDVVSVDAEDVVPVDAPAAPDVVSADAPDVIAPPDIVDAGPPPCDGGATRCGDLCVDTRTDRANCGACGRACCVGSVCSAGQCFIGCASGTTACALPPLPGDTCVGRGVCADLSTDRLRCGRCDLACADGDVCFQGECARRTPDGSFLPPSRPGVAGPLQVVATDLGGVQGLLLAPDARAAYVSATGLGVIWRVPLDQALPATPTRWADGLVGPSQMTFDDAGRIVVAEREGNRVTRIAVNPDGSAGARAAVNAAFQGPWGVLALSNGDLLVSNEFGNSVDRVTPMGAVTRGVIPMFPAPLDLRLDAAGNLYVGDYGNPLTSGTNVFVHDAALARNRTITGLAGPIGIALDRGGDVYVANYTGNNVVRVPPTGSPAVYAAGLSGPHAIAFDLQGRLYVADYGNQRLVRFPRGN